MGDPTVILEGLDAHDRRVEMARAAVITGEVDQLQVETTMTERLFNQQTASRAREYSCQHPGDEKFVPEHVTEPSLTSRSIGGRGDGDFVGEPWFERAVPNGTNEEG